MRANSNPKSKLHIQHHFWFGGLIYLRGAGYSTSITDFWLLVGRAFGDFLYSKLLWLKSAKLPLRALQNSINRNVVPVNGCNNCLHPWGIMDGEYINMRSGRAREAEQVLLIRHSDDATGMMLSGRIFTQGQDILYGEGKHPSGHIHNQQFWGEEHWWNRNQWEFSFSAAFV